MKQIVFTIFLLFGANSIYAQKYLDQLKVNKQGEGTVTVNQSKEIDDLVNGKPIAHVETEHSTTKRNNTNNNLTKENKTDATTAPKKQTVEDKSNDSSETTVDSRKKMIRNGHKITGYRIQVFSGRNSRADKIKANDVGSRLKILFPDQPIYVHFYNPRWICRMGNFRTYNEAQNMLNEVKAAGYSQACIVKGQITVQN